MFSEERKEVGLHPNNKISTEDLFLFLNKYNNSEK